MGLSTRWKIITALLILATVLGSLYVSYKLFNVEEESRLKEQLEKQNLEQQKKEQMERELLEKQEKEKLEQEQQTKQQQTKQQTKQKKTQQTQDQAKQQKEQQEKAKKEQEKLEKERQELERIKKEQQEKERQEKERQLKEQQEKERLQKEQEEKKRLEQEQKAKQEKKIIDAIKGDPYCEKGEIGYLDFSKTQPYDCYQDIYDKDALIYSCPSGYKLNSAQTICEKGENRPDVKGIEIPSCTGGGMLYQETTNGAYECTTGFFYMDYKCPNGYKFVSESTPLGTYKGCEWQDPYKTTYVTKTCSKGTYNRSTGTCYYFTTSPLSYKYSCPSGYTLKGDKCYEN